MCALGQKLSASRGRGCLASVCVRKASEAELVKGKLQQEQEVQLASSMFASDRASKLEKQGDEWW